MLVHEFLENSAQRTPEKVALICAGQRLTYRHVDEEANRVANALLTAGVQRGERVAVWLPNSVEAVLAIFGILKAGATFVVINTTTKPDKLTYVLNNCQAKVLFAPGRQAETVASTMAAVPSLALGVLCDKGADEGVAHHSRFQSFAALVASARPDRPARSCIDVDLACLIYTSGSTGDPKGVMSTHANVAFAASSIITYLENVPDDIIINVLPLSFDYGLYQLLMTFKFGGTLVLERSFAYPAATLKRIEEEHVTGLPGVPTLFAHALADGLEPVRPLVVTLRDEHSGGATCRAYPAATRCLSLGQAFLDVRSDGVQAHALSAARRTQPPPRLGRDCHPRHGSMGRGRGRATVRAGRDRRIGSAWRRT